MTGFDKEADALHARAKQVQLKILIWGPGDPGPKARGKRRKGYNKRCKIREVLRKEFPNSEVYFSEDPEMQRLGDGVIGQLSAEALQAFIADLVLTLDISRGADLEVDHFVLKYSWFRNKVYVFLPQEHVSSPGLAREVFKWLPVGEQLIGYTKDEFEHCTLATETAVKIVQTAAVLKLINQ